MLQVERRYPRVLKGLSFILRVRLCLLQPMSNHALPVLPLGLKHRPQTETLRHQEPPKHNTIRYILRLADSMFSILRVQISQLCSRS